MTYIVFDSETTVKNSPMVSDYVVGEETGSPFHPDNRIVMSGWKLEGQEVTISREDPPPLEKASLLVGHNIRFDMHYLVKTWPHLEEWFWNPENRVWDTQLAEYLLTAQQAKFATLDSLAPQYGGELKDSSIKEFWEAGGQTEDLPDEKIVPYLIGDVENTELVFQGQLHTAVMLGMMPLIETQMRALVATWEMRKNGMCFDMGRAVATTEKLRAKAEAVTATMQKLVDEAHPASPPGTFLPNSNDVISRMLFGGTYSYYTQEPVMDEFGEPVKFKSGKRKGQVKTAKTEHTASVEGPYTPQEGWETKKAGTYKVGEEVILALAKQQPSKVLQTILKLRAIMKDLETYFVGYSKLAWYRDGKHYIHGDLNHVVTDTGRLSSSKPNLQNLSKRERDE